MVTYFRPSGAEIDDPVYYEELKARIEKLSFASAKDIAEQKKHIKYPEYLSTTKSGTEGTFVNAKNKDGAKNDRGHLGDPQFRSIFPPGQKIVKNDLLPNFGTEIHNVQLSELDDAGKNDLALLLETRGLVVFRNQDFRDKGGQFQVDFGKYFGPLHVHPVAYTHELHPELFVTFRKGGDGLRYEQDFQDRTGAFQWHSDVSFEEYPASFSFFVALEAPPSGGDTVFVDLREAYRRLSPALQKFFETLTVVHTNHYQRKFAALRGQAPKVQETLYSEHPLVRTHPVTGEKLLYFSRGFISKIKGVKASESAFILNFLEDHVLNNPEFQVRAQHNGTDSGTVIAWDNRFLVHTATADFLQHETGPRHHFRITVVGEKPYFEGAEREREASPSGRPRPY